MKVRVIDSVATSNNLKKLFKERGLTPKAVQKVLRLRSVQSVYKWIGPQYKTLPSMDSLVQLTGLLGCELEDVLVMVEIDE